MLSNQAITESLQATNAIIELVTGVSQRSFFRPPYGSVNQRVANIAAELGYAIVNWTLDTADWLLRDADRVYNAVMKNVKENSIILLHDIHFTTAVAMERVIPALIAEGYQLVTVSELLYHLHGTLQPGRVYGNPGLERP
jgi:peptidoglycan/xylan/chitin deacetylase (PgdA/CDA1 family)